MESKSVLIEVFGEDVGRNLFGAAVKLSAIHNVDLDDVIQDMMIEALDVEKEYGFIHINTTVQHTKNAIFATYNYGINRYYTELGVVEQSIEAHEDVEDYLDIITFDINSTVRNDLSSAFADSLESVSVEDRQILAALAANYKATEIAQQLGRSDAYVSNAKKRLQSAFSWALA